MIKKLFSFILCLAPLGALADTPVEPEENPVADYVKLTPIDGNGTVILTEGLKLVEGATKDNPRVVWNWTNPNTGAEVLTKSLVIDSTEGLGLDIYGLSVGDSGNYGTGFLYVPYTTTAPTTGFTISSKSDVSISAILRVLAGNTLTLQGDGTNINFMLGNVSNGGLLNEGTLTLSAINNFVSSNVISNKGNLTIGAQTMTMNGKGLENRGTVDITVAGAMDMGNGDSANPLYGTITSLQAAIAGDGVSELPAATSAKIKAASLTSGAIQNNSGIMTINVSAPDGTQGDLTVKNTLGNDAILVSGVIENKSGTEMEIRARNITLDGAMTNEGNNSNIRIVASGDLTINGKNTTTVDENGTLKYPSQASFVNGGNLYADVAGAMTLANGFDLSTMATTNTFEVNTGTLSLGNRQNLFSNNLNKFILNVHNGNIDETGVAVINGAGGNTSANMTLTAQGLHVGSVVNSGQNLYIAQVNNDVIAPISGNIVIDNGVTANSGYTQIWADDNVTSSAGTVSAENGAELHISGEKGLTVANVYNNGKILLQSSNATEGNINITGNVTNESGTLNIESRSITVAGTLASNGGVTTIDGSDVNGGSLSLGRVDVFAGIVNINAIKGGITMAGPLTVKANGGGVGGGLNISQATNRLDVTGNSTAPGDVLIAGELTLSPNAVSNGNRVNIDSQGVQNFVMTSTGTMTFDGGINAISSDANRTAQFIAKNVLDDDGVTPVANNITVGDNGIAASGQGHLIFGDATNHSNVTTTGMVTANKDTAGNVGSIEFYSDQVTVGSLSGDGKFIAHGREISATEGGIVLTDGIRFNSANPTAGLSIKDTTDFTLTTADDGAQGGSISVAGGVAVAAGNTLHMLSSENVNLNGIVSEGRTLDLAGTLDVKASSGDIVVANEARTTTQGALTAAAENITMAKVTNQGQLNLDANRISLDSLVNTGQATLTAADTVIVPEIRANAGVLTVDSNSADITTLSVANGAQATFVGSLINVAGATTVVGDLVQGNATGALNFTSPSVEFTGRSVNVTGNFKAEANSGNYTIANALTVGGDIIVDNGTNVFIEAQSTTAKNLTNRGKLVLTSLDGISLSGNDGINNSGDLTLSFGNNVLNVANFVSTGKVQLDGAGLNTASVFEQAALYQNAPMATLGAGDVNAVASDFTFSAPSVVLGTIKQYSGSMVMNTSDVTVANDIDATDLRIQATPATNWLNVGVLDGNVSGNVQFIGLEHMDINGNYTFNDKSKIDAAILPYAVAGDTNSTAYNYWADVSLVDDSTLGQITNRGGDAAEPLISVSGQFITDLDIDMRSPLLAAGIPVDTNQVSIRIFDMINPGTAIWLVHADGGVTELGPRIRNLNVLFCNADGSKCFNYYGSAEKYNDTGTDLPAYLTVRDSARDGFADSLYIVFDPRFGGPRPVFKIQPIVEREPDHTKMEYVSAGALDDLIAGQLEREKFSATSPIEAISVAFEGTNMAQLANELYNRMEYYDLSHDGTGLARFSRLTQAREIEQLMGSVVLNEHTTFRDFEDRMLDEFIWHRNRNRRKAWGEFDYGMISQKASDSKTIDSTRFAFSGGYDWQETSTMILGVSAHLSHMKGDNSDSMNLGYRPGEFIDGHVKIDVADTNIGIGGYLLKTLTTKMRLYGNAFLDMHWLDVSRDQNYVNHIDGSGTAFSLISEWGVMHDWLNQYVVGNAYVRAGYNTGFSVTEKAQGRDYMKMESDGYLILTPGYSLIAQKRIYPDTWFQIRPYVSVGAEYDIAGAPDSAKYRFAPARRDTKYSVDIDPLWANIGGGVEFVSVKNVQVGLDYRYQYNSDIQMHKIKLSGSYRF